MARDRDMAIERDGQPSNYDYLFKVTTIQHTAARLSQALLSDHPKQGLTNLDKFLVPQFARDPKARKKWLDDACISLKHDPTGPQILTSQMKAFLVENKQPSLRGKIKAALTYFQNQQQLMKYVEHLKHNLPLGSGVTEAACKTIVKQRLCCSGMKWKEAGAAVVLSLRTLTHSNGRWEQFWSKIDQYGFPVAA